MALSGSPKLSDARSHNAWDNFAQYLRSCHRILCLVGAGLSAPSGLPTWRGSSGLWNNVSARELAYPSKFKENPALVWRFYGERMIEAIEAQPNAGHYALAEFAAAHDGFMVVCQNIDGLCDRAGHPSNRLQAIHGTLNKIRCTNCEYRAVVDSLNDLAFLNLLKGSNETFQPSVVDLPHCPRCSSLLRPDVVWFGEKLAEDTLETIDTWIDAGPIDLVLAIGTSLRVFPAAEFVDSARRHGARLAVVNSLLEDGPIDGLEFDDWFFEGDASVILPMILKFIL